MYTMNEEVVKNFIYKREIAGVVLSTKINDNKCHILLRGGFSMSIEIIDDILYKDGEPYCTMGLLLSK